MSTVVYKPITLSSSTFEVSAGFTSEEKEDVHEYSSWQVSELIDFSVLKKESLYDRANLRSFTFDPVGVLELNTEHYWRVKYNGLAFGESNWSDIGTFKTSTTYECNAGEQAGGGIIVDSFSNYCLVTTKFDGEPTGSGTFRHASSEVAQLTGTVLSGDLTYRTDLDVYYVNYNGSNSAMSDWVLIVTQTDKTSDYYVSSESDMLLLTINKGEMCIRTDTDQSFVNTTGNNVNLTDWVLVDTPVKVWWLAKQYCLNLEYGGFTDWTMPEIAELESIYDNLLVIDTTDTTGNLHVDKYWSSSATVFKDKHQSWMKDFDNDVTGYALRNNNFYYVRPVRRM
jgi:hypothetical protein